MSIPAIATACYSIYAVNGCFAFDVKHAVLFAERYCNSWADYVMFPSINNFCFAFSRHYIYLLLHNVSIRMRVPLVSVVAQTRRSFGNGTLCFTLCEVSVIPWHVQIATKINVGVRVCDTSDCAI